MKSKKPNSISQNIKKYRLLNNLTQEKLSEMLNLDTQYYAQLERGERNFTIEKIIRLCSIFHVGIENIIEIDTLEEKTDSEQDKEILDSITQKLEKMTHSQLILMDKLASDIIPYTK